MRFAGRRTVVIMAGVMAILLLMALAAAPTASRAARKKAAILARADSFATASSDLTPTVIHAEKSDLSPPLRFMHVVPPEQSDEILEIPLGKSDLPGSVAANGSDPVVQRHFGRNTLPAPIQNFEGLGNLDGYVPADSNGDVGPNHYVQMVNVSFGIWDKSGNLLFGPANNNTLWAGFGGPCEVDNNGDPIVLYDHLADRWLLSQFAWETGAHECIAISQTGDPLGAYYRYAFNIGGFPDYPKLGVWPDAYYATFRNIDAAFDMQAAAFNRTRMLAGDPTAEAVIFSISAAFPGRIVDGFLPADLDGPAPPPAAPGLFAGFFSDERRFDDDTLALFEMRVDWSNPGNATFSGPLLLPAAPFDPALCNFSHECIPQPGTSQGLDAISALMMFRLAYRNFGFYQALVATHTVDVGGDHAGKRWYELRNAGNGWGIYQQGTYAPDADHRWMGSIAMDAAGNIGLGYSVSSETVYPSIRYTGRLVSDPLGTMAQGEGEIIAGGGAQLHPLARWGDYSAMTVDQTDDCTFWYTTEYLENSGFAPWQTRIASFRFADCPNPAVSDFSLWGLPGEQAVCAPDPAGYDVTAFAIGSYGQPVHLSATGVPGSYEASFTSNPVTPPANTVLNLTNTGTATTGSYEITIAGAGPTQTHTTTVTLNLSNGVPPAPALTGPADDAANQSVRPLLQWTAVPDGTSYLVEVATDADFSDVVDSAIVRQTSYQVRTQLAFETGYHWRVTAQNSCGSGGASDALTFTTTADRVVCPEGLLPTDLYLHDFDPGAPGWTHTAVVGPDTWELNAANPGPGSGGNAWFSEDVGVPADQRLLSPEIALADEPVAMLQFWNEQKFESPPGPGGCWDGGLLEISADAGATWSQLDEEVLTDPYDGYGDNGPPAGLKLWCGGQNGSQPWTNSIVDLGGYSGENVRLRFRSVSDQSDGAKGWYLDDVRITYCAPPSAPTLYLPVMSKP